ncbi:MULTISPECIES: STAS domain-containing protein [unclassified Nocardioides]|uniref:STAS domain-containing protein n=1 Tax=unclassified Nocardioides TaxID=2615069 RepID=UPI003014411D
MLLVQSPDVPPVAHFSLSGDLDVFGALALRRSLNRAAHLTCTDLRVDLSGVEFVDASALGVMARTWHDLESEAGTTVSLVRTNRQVRELRAATGLGSRLPDVARSALPQHA